MNGADRYRAAGLGLLTGALLALLVAGWIGWQLDAWRVRNHSRLVAEVQATYEQQRARDKVKYAGIDPERCREYAALDEAYRNRRPGR